MSLVTTVRATLDKFPLGKQFIKFAVVGGTAAGINFLVYISLTHAARLWYVYASIWAFLISAVFNFTANKVWTFRNKERGRQVVQQLRRYAVVMVSGLMINTIFIYSLTEWGGLNNKVSWVFATGAVMLWNFNFNRLWTFKRPTE